MDAPRPAPKGPRVYEWTLPPAPCVLCVRTDTTYFSPGDCFFCPEHMPNAPRPSKALDWHNVHDDPPEYEREDELEAIDEDASYCGDDDV